MPTIPFSARAVAPDGVLFRELDGEAVLLSLEVETYFGLDDVGTRTWELLTTTPTIQAAFDALCAEYEADREQIRRDLEEFVDQLIAHRLIQVT